MFPKSQLLSQSGGVLKVPLAKLGKWFHKAYGIVEFTRDDFKAIIDNFRDNLLGHKPYLTFGHLQEDLSIDSHRKKGDMIGFAEESDTLYGLFKATEDAYQSVQSGEYEFSSGEFIRDFLDKASGKSKGTLILRVALTNSPFIPNLDRVQAFSQSDKGEVTQVFTMKIDMKNNNDSTEVNETNLSGNDSQVISTPETNTEGTMDKDFVQTVDKVDSNEPTNEVSVVNNLDKELDAKDETSKVTPEVLHKESLPQESLPKSTPRISEDLSVSSTPSTPSSTSSMNTPTNNQSIPSHLDIDTLIGDISNKLERKYERTLQELSSLVNDLQSQLVAKQKDLDSVRSITQAQALSLSQAQRQVLTAQEKVTAEYLMGEGVSPALIQRFSQIKDAIISNSQVIRLSENGEQGEREVSLIQALSDLVVDATNTPAINLSQEGVPYYRYRDDYNGLLTVAEKTIRENRQKAQQQRIK